jgi:prolyl oligopeptidase
LALTVVVAANACSPYPPPPDTRREPVTYTLHGVDFVDDYEWLGDQESPDVRDWIAAQNAYSEQIIGEGPVLDRFREILTEATDEENVGSTRTAGGFEYFSMRRVGEESGVTYRRPVQEGDSVPEPSVDEEYEVVLDPTDFDPTYRTQVSLMGFSPDEAVLMYSIRQGGADEIEVRFRDIATREDLPDRLPNALYGGIDWNDESTGFHYVHRDRELGPRLRFHELGEDRSEDEVVWGEAYGPTAFLSRDELGDGYTLYGAQHGWARNDVYLQHGDGPIRPVVVDVPAHFQVRYRDGRLYIRTDLDASNYRLMVADPGDPAPERWTELIPEGEDLLESFTFLDDRIFATYLHQVENRVHVFEMDGTRVGEVEVPAMSSLSIRSEDDGKAVMTVSGYVTPATEYEFDLETLEAEVSEPPEDAPEGYAVTKIWFTSAGGARAPVYVMHREGIALDGSHPTVLSGYGGFNVSIKPGFSTTRMAWLEMGGVYAVATLRGGSEFGETWHQGGMLQNKQHVFDDFIAAAEALVAEGFTSPERLGISGASNGGLLVASAMTQRPDLFRAVVCTYPDLDMVRFFQFGDTNNKPALLEYGDARIPEQFEALRRYSPYQAVRDGVDYPAVMLNTGDLDTRVPPVQARRMAARLQEATTSGLPVILWYEERGGHAAGRGRPMSAAIEASARELTFLARQLGLGEG